MGDLAADRPAWWRWAYLGLWQSSGQLQMISPSEARWHWAYLGSAMRKPAKSLMVLHPPPHPTPHPQKGMLNFNLEEQG